MKAHRTDANQTAIVTALKRLGFGVVDLSGVGIAGVPDLLVCDRDGRMMLLEVKNPEGRNRVSEEQEEWHAAWPGEVYVVRSLDDVLKLLRRGVQR